MLRPLYLDLFVVLLPLAAGLAALAGGRRLHRAPPWLFRGVIGLAVVIVLLLGLSYFVPFPEPVGDALWHVGGEAPAACVAALLLLGVVWAARGRSTSTGFLRTMAGLVLLILLLSTRGRLWWRAMSPAAWANAPDAAGWVTQTTGWTCSPAAATMLLHQHGVATTEGEMAYLADTSYLGTDVRSIAYAMTLKGRPSGVVARVLAADYDACIRQPGPFLACVHVPRLGSHAVFVLRVTADDVELVDPRFGKKQKIDRAEIQPQWEGKIVRLEVAQ